MIEPDFKAEPPSDSSRLGDEARDLFELAPTTMMLVETASGRVIELNAAGRRRLDEAFRAGDLKVRRSDDGAHDLLLDQGRPERRLILRRQPLTGRSDVDIAAIVDEQDASLLPEDLAGRILDPIDTMTARIVHDVRNLILPLTSHADLIRATVDDASEAYGALLDVQAACRRCDSELEELTSLFADRATPARYVSVEDLLERSAFLLRYLLPPQAEIEVEAADEVRLVQVSPSGIQRRIVYLAALAHDRRTRVERMRMRAGHRGDDILIELEIRAPIDAGAEELAAEQAALHEQAAAAEGSPRVEGEVDAAGITIRLHLHRSLDAEIERHESRRGAPGQGERIAILQKQPMAGELVAHYLESRNYRPELCRDVEHLLDRLAEGREAVVAELEESEAKRLAAALHAGEAPGLGALVLIGGDLPGDTHPAFRRLEPPIRIDDIAVCLRELLDDTRLDT